MPDQGAAIGNGGSAKGPPIWRGLCREELDRAYNNSAAVRESPAFLADWTARSAVLRGRHSGTLDLSYGPGDRNRIDLFLSRPAAPLFVFIHGGYWQRNSKDMFAFAVEGLLSHGVNAALVGYTLCPDIRLSGIVAEVRRALDWLRTESPLAREGISRLVVSGWSAGGHLGASLLDRNDVDGLLAISGIYDIAPCRLNYLNDALRLTAEDVVPLSPLHRLPTSRARVVLAYGSEELPELRRQSEDYARARIALGLPSRVLPLNGRNHFSILEDLADPRGDLALAALDLLTAG